MSFFDLFKKKDIADNVLDYNEKFTGYIIKIKKSQKYNRWNKVYMGENSKNISNVFYLDDSGLNRLKKVTANDYKNTKLIAYLKEAEDVPNLKSIMGWKFV